MPSSGDEGGVVASPASALDIQITAIESYSASPTSADCVLSTPFNIYETPLTAVPAIRVFGATRSGQRVCLHVHQAWPYMYVRYTGPSNLQSVRKFGYQLGLSLNSALNLSLGGHNSVHIVAVIPVKGVPFYGYSLGHQPFLKIQFANASVVSRASSLLASGAVMGQKFELFESHLPHTLQFLIDYNLYGMDWLSLASVRFRDPLPAANTESSTCVINDSSVPLQSRWVPPDVPRYLVNPPAPERESSCELEADALAMDIINRRKVQERSMHCSLFESEAVLHPGRLVPSLDVIWADENRRRSKNGMQQLLSAPCHKKPLAAESSTETRPNQQWSNHWHTWSMFESALAEDWRLSKQGISCKLYDSSWLEHWPSCYQVDMPNSSIFGLNKGERFYLPSDDNVSHIPAHEPARSPIAVDIALVAQATPKISKTRQTDRASISSGSDSGSCDEIGMDFFDNWLEYENEFSDSACSATSADRSNQDTIGGIPQVDGANDRRLRRGSTLQRNYHSRSERKQQTSKYSSRRMLLPLDLRPTSRTRDRPKVEILPFRRAKRVRKCNFDVFVDIPHPEGSRCNQKKADIVQESHGFYKYAAAPPTTKHLFSTLESYGIPEEVAPRPQYSDATDVPRRTKLLGGAQVPSLAQNTSSMELFIPNYASCFVDGINVLDTERNHTTCRERRNAMWSSDAIDALVSTGPTRAFAMGWSSGWWSFARQPPRRLHLNSAKSVDSNATPVQRRQRDQSDLKWGSVLGKLMQRGSPGLPSQVDFSSPHNAPNQPSLEDSVSKTKVPASLLAAEVLASSRHQMLPDPQHDSILLIASCFSPDGQWNTADGKCVSILWTCQPCEKPYRLGISDSTKQRSFANEAEMLVEFAQWVRGVDPDILCGYEVQKGSWGFIIERAQLAYGLQLSGSLSRLLCSQRPKGKSPVDSWSYRKGAAIKIAGRHVLNIWRLLRSELNLTSYTFENAAAIVLGERSPRYAFAELARWYQHGPAVAHIRALRHVHYRATAAIRILHSTDIVARTSEFARVIGIDFNSVITRGSQLRVESLMARIAHPEHFILASPTRQQVSQQRAAECLPLVLEPQSNYYTDPVVVLDFQSLYPSIMIAYNYCFSTCLGSLDDTVADSSGGVERRLGFTNLHVPPGLLSALKDHITISPNGVMFVKPSVRKGLLGRMLQEILDSRMMIKEAMELWSDDNGLYKTLDSWQLGLKLIANVTYGYAGASFSGRMPCVEIADAIVQSGRETLENAIRLIHSRHADWGGKVVYGDTDSVFVWLPGRSRQQAFRIGREIAAAVTEQNPAPVALKFEKVYQPCVLLTKKRYAGWMYETEDQAEPTLDVKGMELVRRDGCTATQRILEGAISTLFETNDLSLLKAFLTRQFSDILGSKVPIHEFIIAKEVRMHSYSGRMLPAHAKVAADGMELDPQAEPEYGERVPYVVVHNGPHARLADRVVSPHTLLAQPQLQLDLQYYIDKQILPALDRLLSLIGVDVQLWFGKMSRRSRSSTAEMLASDSDSAADTDDSGKFPGQPPGRGSATVANARRKGLRTLDRFYGKRSCLFCRQIIPVSSGRASVGAAQKTLPVCSECAANPAALLAQAGAIGRDLGVQLKNVLDKCAACAGGPRADALQAAEHWSRCTHNVKEMELHQTLLGHDGCVNALCWSSDGRYLFSGSDDSTICIWRAAGDGSLLCRFHTGFSERVFDLKAMLVPNQNVLVACSMDTTIKLFDVSRLLSLKNSAVIAGNTTRPVTDFTIDGTACCIRTIASHGGPVKRAALIPDAPFEFLSCSEDGTVRHFDIREKAFPEGQHGREGRVVADYRNIGAEIHALDVNVFHPTVFAAGGSMTSIVVHDRRMPGFETLSCGKQSRRRIERQGNECLVRLRRDKSAAGDSEVLSDETVTGLRFSRDEPNFVIGSWCYDYIYLFDLNRSATYSAALDVAASDSLEVDGSELLYQLSSSAIKRKRSDSTGALSQAQFSRRKGSHDHSSPDTEPSNARVQAQDFSRGLYTGVRVLSREEAPYLFCSSSSSSSNSNSSNSSSGEPAGSSDIYNGCDVCRRDVQKMSLSVLSEHRCATDDDEAILTSTERTLVAESLNMLRTSLGASDLTSALASVSFALRSLTDDTATDTEIAPSFLAIDSASSDLKPVLLAMYTDAGFSRRRIQSSLYNSRACVHATIFRKRWNELFTRHLLHADIASYDIARQQAIARDFVNIKSLLESAIRDLHSALELNQLNILAHYNRLLAMWDAIRLDLLLFMLGLFPLLDSPGASAVSDPEKMRLQAEFGSMACRVREIHAQIYEGWMAIRIEAKSIRNLQSLLLMENEEGDSDDIPSLLHANEAFFEVCAYYADMLARDSSVVLEPYASYSHLFGADAHIDSTSCETVLCNMFQQWRALSLPVSNVDIESATSIYGFNDSLFGSGNGLAHKPLMYLWHKYMSIDKTGISELHYECCHSNIEELALVTTSDDHTYGSEDELDEPGGSGEHNPRHHSFVRSQRPGTWPLSGSDTTSTESSMASSQSHISWPRATREFLPTSRSSTDSSNDQNYEPNGNRSTRDVDDHHMSPPVVLPCRRYRGHCNFQTIKDVNFVFDKYVASGSDDGHFFLWDRQTMEIVQILRGDNEVVNIIEGHPALPIIAVSGIDSEVQIFHLSQGGPAPAHQRNFPATQQQHVLDAGLRDPVSCKACLDNTYSEDPYIDALAYAGHSLVPRGFRHIAPTSQLPYPAVSRSMLARSSEITARNEEMRASSLASSALTHQLLSSFLFVRRPEFEDSEPEEFFNFAVEYGYDDTSTNDDYSSMDSYDSESGSSESYAS
ncbi:DNA polymerase zeta [Coemansia sp. RSA 2336]|nr:DNA polymerase zeta [Coemansia sp. RSA 2336]